MILASAGRRVDSPDSDQSRFPLHNVPIVRMRIRALLQNQSATAVVCSAACGADLLVLSEAGFLGLGRKVILPSRRARFRQSSVTDLPGDWGKLYDSILDEVELNRDLITMDEGSEYEAYSVTNQIILDEAMCLAERSGEAVAAALVWDGVSRGADDLTEAFRVEARKRGLAVVEVRTI
jgi:hypothetical protein